MRERPARLARPQCGVDPRALEEPPADVRQFRRERSISVQHAALRLRPGNHAVEVAGERRVAVPVLQLLQPQPFRLQQIVAMRQPREIGRDRAHQRVHHRVLDHVGAVAIARRAIVVAPAVDDLLVLGERVRHQREQPDVTPENLPDRPPGRLTHRPVLVRKLVQRRTHRQLLAADADPQPGDRLIEQPGPGRRAGDLLFVQQFLQRVLQLVRAEHAQIAQPGPVARQSGVGQLALKRGLVEAVHLQGEEDQVARNHRHPLAHRLVEFADLGIVRIAAEQQLRVGHHAPQHFLDPLEPGNRLRQRGATETGELAGMGGGKRLRVALGGIEGGGEFGAIRGGKQVAEVPGREGSGGGVGHAWRPVMLAISADVGYAAGRSNRAGQTPRGNRGAATWTPIRNGRIWPP